MSTHDTLYVDNRTDWRTWLEKNHGTVKEIWLIYYKKHTGKPRIPYDDAVEEALCFGWIDSIVKRIDDEKYCQKFTPRKEKSTWSESNKKRVKKMIDEKKMTEAGMIKIRAAKKNGYWDKPIHGEDSMQFPPEFKNALESNSHAKVNFEKLALSQKKQYIGWIATAKKSETRERRIMEAIHLLEKNQNLGMK